MRRRWYFPTKKPLGNKPATTQQPIQKSVFFNATLIYIYNMYHILVDLIACGLTMDLLADSPTDLLADSRMDCQLTNKVRYI